ncbi:MAG: hypothetical protein AAF583_13115 [Pseudomonadota bacterium]
MARLRAGLVDPSDIDAEDVHDYLASTYFGYFRSAQQRLFFVDNFLRFPPPETVEELSTDCIALQLRKCGELITFAVSAFNQFESGLLLKKQRKLYRPKDVAAATSSSFWPKPILPVNAEGSKSFGEIKFRNIEELSNQTKLAGIIGRLGAVLHEQQRPRPKITIDLRQLRAWGKTIKAFCDLHLIVNDKGFGWLVDTRAEYKAPWSTEQPINMVKVVLEDV